MNIIAGLGEYILQTHSTKFFEDSMGVEPPPSGYASAPLRLLLSSWLKLIFTRAN